MIGNKTMSFKVSDEKLLKKCTKIRKKVTPQLIKKLVVNLFMVIMRKR